MVDVKIYLMTHKEYNLLDNGLYTPLFLGAEGKEETFDYLRDDVGDNISSKNSIYSEITGLYWIWKNSTADILGLNHYKRYFKKGFIGCGDYLDKESISNDLENYDIILHKRKQVFKNWDLFQNFVSEQDLITSCEVIKRKFPEYYDDYIKMLNQRYLYSYCVFVAKKEIVDKYCSWLFEYLQELEDALDVQSREIGYFAELALSLYAIHNQLKIKSYCLDFRNLEIGFYTDVDFPLWKSQQKYGINFSFLINLGSKSHFVSISVILLFKFIFSIQKLFKR